MCSDPMKMQNWSLCPMFLFCMLNKVHFLREKLSIFLLYHPLAVEQSSAHIRYSTNGEMVRSYLILCGIVAFKKYQVLYP